MNRTKQCTPYDLLQSSRRRCWFYTRVLYYIIFRVTCVTVYEYFLFRIERSLQSIRLMHNVHSG